MVFFSNGHKKVQIVSESIIQDTDPRIRKKYRSLLTDPEHCLCFKRKKLAYPSPGKA